MSRVSMVIVLWRGAYDYVVRGKMTRFNPDGTWTRL
jgi:hypothetical protein